MLSFTVCNKCFVCTGTVNIYTCTNLAVIWGWWYVFLHLSILMTHYASSIPIHVEYKVHACSSQAGCYQYCLEAGCSTLLKITWTWSSLCMHSKLLYSETLRYMYMYTCMSQFDIITEGMVQRPPFNILVYLKLWVWGYCS